MNRLLSVVSMGLARRWKTILMFLGAWWIITSFLMKIFANGDLSTFGTYFPIYFDNEIAIILLLIGIGYIVEQFRLESKLGLTRKEQIESLFIQTLVDSGVITLIYALLIPLRNGVSLGSVTIQSILGDLFDPENIVISIAVLFVKVVLIHLIANVIGIVLNKINQKAKSGIDIICYKFKKYYEDKGTFEECDFYCPDIEKISTLAERINEMVRRDAFYCSAWSKAIRLDIIKDNNIKFEKGLLGEDQEWYYHILINAKTITYIDEVFLVYRQRANSITSSWKMKNLVDCIYVVTKWYYQIPNEEIDENYKKALLNSVAKLYCNLLIAYTRFKNNEKKKFYPELEKMHGLLLFHENPRTKIFYRIYKLIGFKGLITVLKIICKLR